MAAEFPLNPWDRQTALEQTRSVPTQAVSEPMASALAPEPPAPQEPSTRLPQLRENLVAEADPDAEFPVPETGAEGSELPILETIKRWRMTKFGARE